MPRLVLCILVLVMLPVAVVDAQNEERPTVDTAEWCLTPDIDLAIAGIAEQLPRRGGYLGVYLGSPSQERMKALGIDGKKGAFIEKIADDSPASRAGLMADDLIVSVDGEKISSNAELQLRLITKQPGSTVDIELYRNGSLQHVSATLGEFKGTILRLDPESQKRFFGNLEDLESHKFELRLPLEHGGFFDNGLLVRRPLLGVSVLPMSDQLRDHFGVEQGKGVLVSSVSTGSAAERAGIMAGDVIVSVDGNDVRTLGDIVTALSKGADTTRTVEVRVVRNRSLQIFNATIEATPAGNEE